VRLPVRAARTLTARSTCSSIVNVVRTFGNADDNAKYEAHMTKADGTPVTVYVDEDFNVVGVDSGGPGGMPHSTA
jgi:hypothetical protein